MIGLCLGAFLAGVAASFIVSFAPFLFAVLGGAIFSAILGAIQHQSGVDILVNAVLLAAAAQVGYAAGLTLLAMVRTTRSAASNHHGAGSPIRGDVDRLPPDKEVV